MIKEKHMNSRPFTPIARNAMLVVWVAILSCVVAAPLYAQSTPQGAAPSATAQKAFDTPQQAVEALIAATGSYDVSALFEIFGPDGKDFIASADPVRDKNVAAALAAEANEKKVITVDPKNKTRAMLSVGNDDFPFPVPIVKQGGKWHFNSKEGRNEILLRRIGANELDAI